MENGSWQSPRQAGAAINYTHQVFVAGDDMTPHGGHDDFDRVRLSDLGAQSGFGVFDRAQRERFAF